MLRVVFRVDARGLADIVRFVKVVGELRCPVNHARVTPPQPYGALLRRLRSEAWLTQEQLAEKSGLSPRTIQGMEAGRVRRPHRESVKLLASALNLSGEGYDVFLAAAEAGFITDERTRAPRNAKVSRPVLTRYPTGWSVPLEATGGEHDVLVQLCLPALNGVVFTLPTDERHIAGALRIDEADVRDHLRRLYDKFGISADSDSHQRRVRLANEAMSCGAVTVAELRAAAHEQQ